MDAKTWKRGNLNIKRGMKPRTVVKVSELKNENNGRNRTYDMRSEDRSATCCHHRNFHLCPKVQLFSEPPNQKQIIITYGCKKHGKLYKKAQNAS